MVQRSNISSLTYLLQKELLELAYYCYYLLRNLLQVCAVLHVFAAFGLIVGDGRLVQLIEKSIISLYTRARADRHEIKIL